MSDTLKNKRIKEYEKLGIKVGAELKTAEMQVKITEIEFVESHGAIRVHIEGQKISGQKLVKMIAAGQIEIV